MSRTPATGSKRPSQIAAERLRHLRERKRWSQQDLADRLAEMGAPTDRATIARTEAGNRGLSLDDVLMFAAALDVSPLTLLLPDDEDARVALAPGFAVDAESVRRWLCGVAPLPLYAGVDNPGLLSEEEQKQMPLVTADGKVVDRHADRERHHDFETLLPLSRWRVRQQPGIDHLLRTADHYAYVSSVAPDSKSQLLAELEALTAEIERQREALRREDARTAPPPRPRPAPPPRPRPAASATKKRRR